MERLWAPWRMSYINKISDPGGCFLCAAAADTEHDEENFVIWRSKHAFSIINLYPYNNGHLMVVPYRHIGDLPELSPEERGDLLDGLVRSEDLLRKVMKPNGFNVGFNIGKAAGAGVAEHVHAHIVPRWDGDTNFMPVLADVKIVPQALKDLYAQLKDALKQ